MAQETNPSAGIDVYRQNFYLWMFISQEGLWSEAKEFVEENMQTPMPFESNIKTRRNF